MKVYNRKIICRLLGEAKIVEVSLVNRLRYYKLFFDLRRTLNPLENIITASIITFTVHIVCMKYYNIYFAFNL